MFSIYAIAEKKAHEPTIYRTEKDGGSTLYHDFLRT